MAMVVDPGVGLDGLARVQSILMARLGTRLSISHHRGQGLTHLRK